jgi:hypothetical protein
MHQVKTDAPMQFSDNEIGANLPEVIIKMHAPLLLFPEARPAGQIKVHPVDVGQRLHRERLLNRGPVIRPGYDPDFMVAPHLLRPIPANTWLGTSFGLTRIS